MAYGLRVLRQLWTFPATLLLVLFTSLLLALLHVLHVPKMRHYVQTASYRLVLRVWRVRMKVYGTVQDAPALIVANHCGYVDVAALGALGAMRFTPKSDVRHWPLIGLVVQAYDVIFVDRVPGKAKKAQADLMNALQSGSRICVFPEGTTNDGRSLKPFKSSLFSLAECWSDNTPFMIQPVVLVYDAVDGQPMNDDAWDKIAWYGDDTFLGHLWRFGAIRSVNVTIYCLPPVPHNSAENRKVLCMQMREAILNELNQHGAALATHYT